MSQTTMWEKTLGYSKRGFDKTWHKLDRLGDPVNRLSNLLGSEAFWPMTLDKESDKAARILRSFCKDGFYAEETDSALSQNARDKPRGKQRDVYTIPAGVIQRAKGLAIFTTVRSGLWFSGAGGSGILVARILETGEWSPPSGIMLHTAGVGVLAGADIYDCVVVINTYEALQAFKRARCTLGGELSAAVGPVGLKGVLESEVHQRQAPIWTYMKSRGLYAGVQVDGTIIIERADENERFYGVRISATDILAGQVKLPPSSIKGLMQTIKAAQGDMDVDESLIPQPGKTPGDLELQTNRSSFGIPAPEDPDPFGVKALEAEGLFIREAGTKIRPRHDAFEFRPGPNSPVYSTFSQRTSESSPRNSWRTSVQSYASIGVQTDQPLPTVSTSVSRASSVMHKDTPIYQDSNFGDGTDDPPDSVPSLEQDRDHNDRDYEDDYEEEDDGLPGDDCQVHEVSNATISRHDGYETFPATMEDHVVLTDRKRQSPSFTRARLVTIPKRPSPPALPPRHPEHSRDSRPESQVSNTSPPISELPGSPSVSGRVSGLPDGFTSVSLANNSEPSDDEVGISAPPPSEGVALNRPANKTEPSEYQVDINVPSPSDEVDENGLSAEHEEFHSVHSAHDSEDEEDSGIDEVVSNVDAQPKIETVAENNTEVR